MIYDIPDSMTTKTLFSLLFAHHILVQVRAKVFKIIQQPDRTCKLIVYLANYDDLTALLGETIS